MSEKLNLLKKALGRCWSNGEEHLFHCPKCNHHKLKLSVNIEKGVFKCWICDYSGTKVSPLIRRYAPSLYADWRQLEGEIDLAKYDTIFAEEIEDPPQVIDIPENFQTLTGKKTKLKKKALNYLYSRGFSDLDILRWKIGFCNYGEYRDRIIVPSFDHLGNLKIQSFDPSPWFTNGFGEGYGETIGDYELIVEKEWSAPGFIDGGVLVGNFAARRNDIEDGIENPSLHKPLYRLAVTSFKNRDGLLFSEGNVWRATAASGASLPYGISGQGIYGDVFAEQLEGSNVDVAKLGLDMARIQRSFNAVQGVLDDINKMIDKIISKLAG